MDKIPGTIGYYGFRLDEAHVIRLRKRTLDNINPEESPFTKEGKEEITVVEQNSTTTQIYFIADNGVRYIRIKKDTKVNESFFTQNIVVIELSSDGNEMRIIRGYYNPRCSYE